MPYDFHMISDKKILHPFHSESTGRTGLPADSKRAPLFLPKTGLQAVMTMHFSIKVVQPLMKAAQWHCHGNHSAGGGGQQGEGARGILQPHLHLYPCQANDSFFKQLCINNHVQLDLRETSEANMRFKSNALRTVSFCLSKIKKSYSVLTEQSSSTMKMVHFCTCMKEIIVAAIFFRITSNDCSSKIKLARSSST